MTRQKKVFCHNLCQDVLITVIYSPHPFGRGFPSPVFECATYGECLVEEAGPDGTKCYDWSNCPFYDKVPHLIALSDARAS